MLKPLHLGRLMVLLSLLMDLCVQRQTNHPNGHHRTCIPWSPRSVLKLTWLAWYPQYVPRTCTVVGPGGDLRWRYLMPIVQGPCLGVQNSSTLESSCPMQAKDIHLESLPRILDTSKSPRQDPLRPNNHLQLGDDSQGLHAFNAQDPSIE